jgi:hypothetical protein
MLAGRPRTATRVARFSSQAGAIPREIPGSRTQRPRKLQAQIILRMGSSLDSAPFGTNAATNSSQREAAGDG